MKKQSMSENKKDLIKTQKKFKEIKDENPIYFLDVFSYNNKTHYMISSNSILYVGYMEKTSFNQLTHLEIKSYVTSFCLHEKILYLGLKNGSIFFASLEHIYNEIPFRIVQSVDGKAILGIAISIKEDTKQKTIYTLSQGSFIKSYIQIQNGFKISKNVSFEREIQRVLSKNQPQSSSSPSFMVQLKNYDGYPILLSVDEVQKIVSKNQRFQTLLTTRQKYYLEDQRIHTRLNAFDFDSGKMICCLGYVDGIIEISNIQKFSSGQVAFNVMTPTLKIKQRDSIRSITINDDSNLKFIAFTTQTLVSGFSYEHSGQCFTRIKNQLEQKKKNGKNITGIKWTKDKNFLIASLSDSETKRLPKVYCIQQEIYTGND